MKNSISIFTFLVFLTLFQIGHSQEQTSDVSTVQPTIMVIPYVKKGGNIRSVIEDDPNRRLALNVVKNGFDKRNFTTYNYEELLDNRDIQKILNSDKQSSLEEQIIRNSPSDITIKVDYIQTNDSNGNMVEILLEGIDSFTGQSLANERGRSRIMNTNKFTILAEQATESCIESFLDNLNNKFTIMLDKGRSVEIMFNLSAESEFNMDSRLGESSTPIKFLVRKWLRDNSYKNYFHLSGSSETSIVADDFRIPVKDEFGNNYQVDTLEEDLFFFFDELGLSVSTSIIGSRIIVTLN